MSDTNERSVASAGSIACEPVAWAAIGFTGKVEFGSDLKSEAEEYAEAGIPKLQVVPLYTDRPQDRLVRLPRWIASGTGGYDQITAALDAAGVKWEIVNNCQ